MNRITLCMAYYENPGMLRRHYQAIGALPAALRAQISIIVVDDGSPTAPAEGPIEDFSGRSPATMRAGESEAAFHARRRLGVHSFKLFRMGVDVAWNMDACRNLAASQAETEWLLLTDIDHLVPLKTWQKVITASLNPRGAYKFGRVSEPDLQPYKPHPNTWLMTRDLYDKAGGYDERFAGWYGTDGPFRDQVARVAVSVQSFKEPIVRVPREVTPDASTTTLVRRSPENAAAIERIKAERKQVKNWRPLRNSFPWQQVI